eukprot:CAMPEP_0117498930 /NCGR_PEP_ID=MMETSP0784-20121206/21975_1 /TAXON_ID=39447 /ORGANISM="" /LENGTH=48 /DNA_ID= /DNA_START= /DNA_END= /DNA_ORIENTATION=
MARARASAPVLGATRSQLQRSLRLRRWSRDWNVHCALAVDLATFSASL